MSDDHLKLSITHWIGELKSGRDRAAGEIWERYFGRLVKHAEKRFGQTPRRVADEEDIAVSVFDSLCEGAVNGRFEQLENRDDLWKLLVAMTGMKVVDQVRKQNAKKRGGGAVLGNSVLDPGTDSTPSGFDQLLSSEPTPEFLVAMEEQHSVLMNTLPDESQRQVARYRMDGYQNKEIAEMMGISLRSVERKLMVIRETWTSHIESV